MFEDLLQVKTSSMLVGTCLNSAFIDCLLTMAVLADNSLVQSKCNLKKNLSVCLVETFIGFVILRNKYFIVKK
jgi:hypothetical protein